MDKMFSLLLGSSFLLCLCQTSLATDNPPRISSIKQVTSSPQHSLDAEEIRYIRLECENFAELDKVSEEKHSTYMKLCIDELSAAVKNAIDELQLNAELPVIAASTAI